MCNLGIEVMPFHLTRHTSQPGLPHKTQHMTKEKVARFWIIAYWYSCQQHTSQKVTQDQLSSMHRGP